MTRRSRLVATMAAALVLPAAIAGASPAEAGPVTSTLTEAWDSSPDHFITYDLARSSAEPGTPDQDAGDGEALRLELPKNATPGAGGGAYGESADRFLYGTFESRLRTADCSSQPDAGVVTGQMFTYFHDGSDSDGDGLPDNSEIDFETLCAQPEVLYMTVWTDYRPSDGAQSRVMRAVNLATGEILSTCHYAGFGGHFCDPLAGDEAQPTSIPAVPGFDSSSAYYEYGFTWEPDGVHFWIVAGGQTITLWDYQGPSDRIPQVPAYLLHNVWHTDGWWPEGEPDAVERPSVRGIAAHIDWTRITPHS
ncbi:glycoside hydrolase family 16 protein [Ruania alba]|uniref:Glycosyl hydrolases family 16 n=1 Tax=Ruania alba TaxID=648782 RepID=A0A1H5M5H3_9MICO|nr:glycoside hydrolase family 16 protein [Ruania alba]SEE83758.1 Glycosyl hydrolases family 16 [Ruania alba]